MSRLMHLMSFMLVAAAYLGSSAAQTTGQTQAQTNNFLVLDKQTINLDESAIGVELSVALKDAPTAGKKVSVFAEGANLRLDKCNLEFTSDNFKTPQKLRVFGVPFSTIAESNRNLPILFKLFSDGQGSHPANGQNQTLPCTRGRGALGRCEFTGDPHIRSFDQNGKLYNYQGAGDFHMVKTETLHIQARHGACFTKATCVIGLAVRYGNTVFVMDGTNKDPNKIVQKISQSMDGVTVSQTNAGSSSSWNIAFADGSNLKVDLQSSGGVQYFNTYLDLDPVHKGKSRGLCGTFNDNAEDEYTSIDGKTVFPRANVNGQSDKDASNQAPDFKTSDLFKFGESMRVADNENIFKCGGGCQVAVGNGGGLTNTKIIECQIPTTSPFQIPRTIEKPCAPTGFAPIIQFVQFNINQNITIVPAPQPPPPSQNDLTVALRGCAQKIQVIRGCEQFDDIQQRILACESDIRGQMNPDTVYETHRLAYTDRCSRVIVSRANEPNPAIAAPAKQAAKNACFGNFPCDSQCEVCTTRGCLLCRDSANFEPQGGRCVPRIRIRFNVQVFSPAPVTLPAPAPQAPVVKPNGVEGVVTAPGAAQGVPLPPPAVAPTVAAPINNSAPVAAPVPLPPANAATAAPAPAPNPPAAPNTRAAPNTPAEPDTPAAPAQPAVQDVPNLPEGTISIADLVRKCPSVFRAGGITAQSISATSGAGRNAAASFAAVVLAAVLAL